MTESTIKLTFNLEKFRKVVNEAADSDEIVMSKEEALLVVQRLSDAHDADALLYHITKLDLPVPTCTGYAGLVDQDIDLECVIRDHLADMKRERDEALAEMWKARAILRNVRAATEAMDQRDALHRPPTQAEIDEEAHMEKMREAHRQGPKG